jgi:hypothetical protein
MGRKLSTKAWAALVLAQVMLWPNAYGQTALMQCL